MADYLTRILLGCSLAAACIAAPCPARGQTGLPGDSLASALYDPATGQITVSVQNVYNWYVESLSGSLTTGHITLPTVPGGLVTNNPNRVGQSSFEAAFSYSDFALGPIATLSLPASDLVLRYSTGYGVPEVTAPVVGGLDLPPIAPGPPPAEPPLPPAEPPFPPLPGLPPAPWEGPLPPDGADAWADAVYDPVTGGISVTASDVHSWYIESHSGSLTGVPLNLPSVEGGLVTDHDLRVGHSSFAATLNYERLPLGAVAAPSLFAGDLVLHYSPGYGLPEVSAWVNGGLPGPPPPPLPPEPPAPPMPPVVVEPPAPPVIVEPPVDPGQPTLPPDVGGGAGGAAHRLRTPAWPRFGAFHPADLGPRDRTCFPRRRNLWPPHSVGEDRLAAL